MPGPSVVHFPRLETGWEWQEGTGAPTATMPRLGRGESGEALKHQVCLTSELVPLTIPPHHPQQTQPCVVFTPALSSHLLPRSIRGFSLSSSRDSPVSFLRIRIEVFCLGGSISGKQEMGY